MQVTELVTTLKSLENTPISKYDHYEKLEFKGCEYDILLNPIPDYEFFPLSNGGKIPINIHLLMKSKYYHLRQFFYNHAMMPVEIINPVLNRMGIGGVNTDLIIEEEIYERKTIDEYIENWLRGDSRGLKLLGNPGTGKTTTVAYILRELLTKSNLRFIPAKIQFYEMSEILAQLGAYNESQEFSNRMKVSLLIIDEFLQNEQIAQKSFDKFHGMINHRYKNPYLITIIISNRTADYIYKKYPLLGSRFSDTKRYFPSIKYTGDDKRTKEYHDFGMPDYMELIDESNWDKWFYLNYENNRST